jgi:predicted enzyme related to lactoylglutathione lyase
MLCYNLFDPDKNRNQNTVQELEEIKMKITSFSPLIISHDAETVIKFYGDLGFEVRHKNTEVTDSGAYDVTMKDADGHRVDVTYSPRVPKDMTIIRMNVESFDEAYEKLTAHGFKQQGPTVELSSSKSAMMVSPSGFAFDLCQHLK